MAGRTHLAQALPVTFGYKAAVWLSMFDRHAERLAQLRPRVLVGQLAGAAGTLASLGDAGLDVQRALMQELGLGVPAATWHVARDGLAEAVSFLGLVTGSLGKIAYDVMLMASTELAEVYEPFVTGRGASSTMPQKRNPISSELMLAAAKAVRQHAGLMLDAMIQDFERATGPWHAEWIALPDSFVLSAGALHQAKFMLGGLIVDERQMRKNLDLTSGLIVAEAVMMGLAPHLGRQQRTTWSMPPAAGSTSKGAGWPTCWPPSRRSPATSTVPRSSGLPTRPIISARRQRWSTACWPAGPGPEFSSGGRRPTAQTTVAGVQISKPGDHRC